MPIDTEIYTHPDWAKDHLTCYLKTSYNNQVATFANFRDQARDVVEIDRIFFKLLSDVVDPKPLYPYDFLTRGHSAFMAASGATMAGQIFEAQCQLRLCLENAAYAFHILDNRDLWEKWMARHDSKRCLENVRKEFSFGNVSRSIKEVRPEIAGAFVELYDRCIDFGAHPNERGFTSNRKIVDQEDGSKRFLNTYLNCAEDMMQFGLRTLCQVGLISFAIAREIYPEWVARKGLNSSFEEMAKRY
ncbi:hypothetical protein [Roseovarius nubinhibens]|uniref:hypothetical protein n=1 Tax=Roseovarius nubinhibens TaxID=314263 RepID=UPI000321D297|nr:hypothetical protein [Roseovarius nubinhibens]